MWLAAAVGAAVVPSLVGRVNVEKALPGLLFMMMAYWQLAPVITMSLGVSLQMRKVTIYPITMPTLFAVEALLRLGTGLEMVSDVVRPVRRSGGGGRAASAELALAFVLFVAFNVLLSAGVRNAIERIFQRRRLREVVVLLVVSCDPAAAVAGVERRERATLPTRSLESGRSVPYWVLPSGVAARIGVGEWYGATWLLLMRDGARGRAVRLSPVPQGCRPDRQFRRLHRAEDRARGSV